MGERINKIVSKTFNYNLPDDYLHQTNSLNLSGSYTYNGPDKVWVFVDIETGKLMGGSYYTEKDDGDLIPTPENQKKVCLTADNDPIIISMICQQGYVEGPTKTENLPDGSTYERLDPTPPDHTYELMECEYDLENDSWKTPLPWKKPHMTWEILKLARNSMLNESDTILRTKLLSEEEIEKLQEYRQKLRDIPSTFAGIDPWKVPFPAMPIEL